MISDVRGAHWKNALHCIRRHSTSKFHIASMDSWRTYTGKTPIDCMIDEHRRLTVSRREEEIEDNRQIMFRLLEIIKFLAKQNLAFRGHDESKDSLNRGNFLELVHHQAKFDKLLRNHLETAGANCTYLSPYIQNELILSLANNIVYKICQEVKDAKYFAILLDEASDTSRQEQVSFILRYVNTVGQIEKRFIGVVAVKQTDSFTLTLAVEDMFEKYGLCFQNLRRQGYDGAANMSGQYSCVQSRIAAKYSKALYVHCLCTCAKFSYRSNLHK